MKLHHSLTVQETDECVLWQGATHGQGYGVVSLNRALAKELGLNRVQFAHRASYLHNVGDIPIGQVVRHKCHTKLCINPKHLVVGTQRQNIQDSIEFGSIETKLTEEDVVAIINSKGSQRTVGKTFGVSGTTIWKIRNGEKWRHVNGESPVQSAQGD